MIRGAATAALAVTLALQMFTSLAATATAVLASVIAADLALPPALVGVFVGIIYIGSMAGSLGSGGFIARFGAIGVSQACVALCALALVAVAASAAPPAPSSLLLVLAPIVLGLGYGPITPASSHVLARTAPPSRLALTFSIKQTGVPAGAALAGAVLPGLAVALGWRIAFVIVAPTGLLIAAVAETSRPSLDADRERGRKLSLAGVLAPLRTVFRSAALAERRHGFRLRGRAGVPCELSRRLPDRGARLPAGRRRARADRDEHRRDRRPHRLGPYGRHLVRPRTLPGLLGVAGAACAYTTAAFADGWPSAVVIAVCTLFGATAIGWNGVQFAEVARHAPAGQAGTVTGASGFVTFAGVVLGPPAFALLATLTESYRSGFIAFGSASLACGVTLLWRGR